MCSVRQSWKVGNAPLEGTLVTPEARCLEELLARRRSFSLDPKRPPRYVSSTFVRRHAELGLIAEA
jgi:hypothetical protein